MADKKILLKEHCLYFLTGANGYEVFAADLALAEVRRNTTLADADLVYQDFYINGDSEAGLKKNQILIMVRKVAVRDSSGSQSVPGTARNH